MRTFLLEFILILLLPCQSSGRQGGKLTESENLELFANCGQQRQSDVPFAAISSRHIIVDVNMDFLRDKFDMNNCRDNIFEISQPDDVNIRHEKTSTENRTRVRSAWYIGSCEADTPRGFILVEHLLEPEALGTPLCMPSTDLQNGDFLELFTERSTSLQPDVSYTEIGFCEDELSRDFCAKEFVQHFVGPVVDPWDDRRTYAGHAYSVGDHVTRIISIHQYKQQICTVSGICDISLAPLEPENSSGGFLNFVEPVFQVSNEPELKVTFVSDESSKETPPQFSNSEVIIFNSDYEEASGESDYDSSEYTDDSVPSSVSSSIPTVFKEVIHISPPEIENSAATIVESAPEPLSAVIIPLPDTPAPANIASEFFSPIELLIAGLIIVALVFYICMCVYGCFGKSERPLSGRVSSNSPV